MHSPVLSAALQNRLTAGTTAGPRRGTAVDGYCKQHTVGTVSDLSSVYTMREELYGLQT